MKEIKLTQGKVALVDDEDFEYLNQFKWSYNSRYASRSNGENGRILMHRFIMHTPEGMDTDHINQDKLDNRRGNLRVATRTENEGNRGLQTNNTSGFKGVSWYPIKNKWMCYISFNKKRKTLGYFKEKEEAALIYNIWALFHFGEFAHLNKVGE